MLGVTGIRIKRLHVLVYGNATSKSFIFTAA